jgi:hypothetical protein
MPKQVSVRVEHDGELLFEDSRDFDYELLFPSGPECGFACTVGSVDFRID